jgi:rhamnosyltransferase
MCFWRQLPHKDATAIAKHARYFNYSDKKYISSKDKISEMGIKTVFSSNSFSAYRISAFMNLGGFPDNTILSEDMYFAAKAIMEGYKLAYCPDATVRHSHNYNSIEEFKRYFDIGVFHTDESWIRDNFGGAGGEGLRFIRSEFNYLIKNKPTEILSAGVHNFAKIVGYKLGQNYKKIPKKYLKNLSMHKRYWS